MGIVRSDADENEASAAIIRMSIASYTGVAYADLRCLYCGRGFDGSTLKVMLADGPVALAGEAGACPVACKACFERKHRV